MNDNTVYDQTLVTEEFCENQVKQSRKIGTGVKIGATAVAGAVAGSAATFGGQAVAANISEETPAVEEGTNGDAVSAEGATAPVAQVSDDMSFGQAFAAARQQVGAGGVFTWHGKVYGTYYKEEWDGMTVEEKADFQASVDYNNVPTNHAVPSHDTHHDAHADIAATETQETEASNTATEVHETVNDSADVDIHVISVEHNVNMNGHDVDVAVIQVDGHNGMLVDIDHDGMVEGAIVDFNDDGQIQQNEVSPDLSGQNIQMPQMSDGDLYMAQNDDMPDYTNDAIV